MALSIHRASSSSAPIWKYDVFLSFRGEDTRRGFISHLYEQLQHYWQAIKTFKDDQELEIGATISTELFKAIEASHLAIVVLSPNYASSTWCLDELAKIVESKDTRDGNTILPVFFDVDPSDVRKQRKTFAEAFTKHEKEFSDDMNKVQRWRTALTTVANLSGWHSKNYECERELIKVIVRCVWSKVPPTITLLDSTDQKLVGMDFGLVEMSLLLAPEVNDVRFIGIWGMGGVGKTTLARLVFEKFSSNYEACNFLRNVRGVSARHGSLLSLQKQLLSPFMKENVAKVWDEECGAFFIREFLSDKKVLLVVDNIDHYNQLELLVGNKSWFGVGSRIIVTTRDERLLIEHDIGFSFKVNVVNQADALLLFSQNAFKKDKPDDDFLQLSKCVVDYAKGLPLALKILGRSLYKRGQDEWISALGTLKESPDSEVFASLKLSYDGLTELYKSIFLDVAVLHKGMNKSRLIEILGISSLMGIKVLVEKSLLTSWGDSHVEMHDLIQELAKEIIRRESPDEPGLRSRLYHRDDIFHVFTRNTGTQAIKGIRLCLRKFEEADSSWTNECFSKMPNLTYLELDNLLIPSSLKFLPNSLRSLQWSWYPSKSLPASYQPNLLVELKMSRSKLVRLWDGKPDLPKLKYIDLWDSPNLTKTPDFTGCPNLETLDLSDCTGLVEIHPTIAVHKKIKRVNFMACRSLKSFPSEIDMESLKDFLVGCAPDAVQIPNFTRGMKNISKLELFGCTVCDLALSSICALRSLTGLSLGDAKLCEGALPDDFSKWLPSLTSLNLDGNDFETLPSSIKFLSALQSLSVVGCRRLKRLPDLPSNARFSVRADDCDCLEILSEPSHLSRTTVVEYFSLSLRNCFRLGNDEGWNHGLWMLRQFAAQPAQGLNYRFAGFKIASPGSKISEWFNNQSEGNSLTIELPSDVESCASKWMGVAVICVVRAEEDKDAPEINSNWRIQCFWQDKPNFSADWELLGHTINLGDHVLVSFIHHNHIQDSTTLPINFQCFRYCMKLGEMIKIPGVMRCGARLVYEQDLEDLFNGRNMFKRRREYCEDEDRRRQMKKI